MIDLHTHSSASDGTCSPTELVALAQQKGLTAVALTDHDTIAGLQQATEAGRSLEMEVIAGIEISAALPRCAQPLHLVGLYISVSCPSLLKTLDWLAQSRHARNPQIIANLQRLGMDITYPEVRRISRGPIIGRPHIAQLMVDKGFVKTINDAFRQYLGTTGKAAVAKERLTAQQAIDCIHEAGGVSILAHPDQLKLQPAALRQTLSTLTDMGLQGMECFSASYPPSKVAQFSRLAKKFNLVRSGGSDFHGAITPTIALGTGTGHMFIPDDILVSIKRAAERPPAGTAHSSSGISCRKHNSSN